MIYFFLILLFFSNCQKSTNAHIGFVVGSYGNLEDCKTATNPVMLSFELLDGCVHNFWKKIYHKEELSISYFNTYNSTGFVTERIYNSTIDCNEDHLVYMGNQGLDECYHEDLYGLNWVSESSTTFEYAKKYSMADSYIEILYDQNDCTGNIVSPMKDCVPRKCVNNGKDSFQGLCGKL